MTVLGLPSFEHAVTHFSLPQALAVIDSAHRLRDEQAVFDLDVGAAAHAACKGKEGHKLYVRQRESLVARLSRKKETNETQAERDRTTLHGRFRAGRG